jgi:hypothetical protein
MRLPSRVRSRIGRLSPPAELSARRLAEDEDGQEDSCSRGVVEDQGHVRYDPDHGLLGNGGRLVALEQATYRARADDRWEPGMKIKLGWHPEHCLVLR